MSRRHQTLPPAQTESARAALQSFYCELCSKGYNRMNDYESHLSSYEHNHKQRLKDMKQMVKDPAAVARARRQEEEAQGFTRIKLGDAVSSAVSVSSSTTAGRGGGGFKKGGFKKSGFKTTFAPVAATPPAPAATTEGGAAAVDANAEALPPSKRFKHDPEDHRANSAARIAARSELVESDTEDEGYEVYDPRYPTD